MSKAHFGLVGLGVMGENLVLNAERNGFSSVVFNRTYSKTEEFLKGRGLGKNIEGAKTLQEFVSKLSIASYEALVPPGIILGPSRAPLAPPETPIPMYPKLLLSRVLTLLSVSLN